MFIIVPDWDMVSLFSVRNTVNFQKRNSDYAFAIDGWNPDNSTYFFGLMIWHADPREYFMVPPVTPYSHEDLMKMIDEYKSLFPYKDSYMPDSYVLSCVD